MADIRTVTTVTVDGEYKVSVGKHHSGDGRYEASVTSIRRSAAAKALAAVSGDGSEWGSIDDAPVVGCKGKYSAVGLAVEQYLETFEDDEDDDS